MKKHIHTIDLHFKGHENGIAAFLVETSSGPVLVETGPHSTFQTLIKGINALGYAQKDIAHVFLTHIHLDHAGAAWCFARTGSTIYLHPFGYRHMNDPSKLLASAKMIYQEEMEALWGTLEPIAADQLVVVEDGQIIDLEGAPFKAWHTPGHAKHHIAWQHGDVLFTGDVAGVSINQGPVIPPCPPPDIHIEEWLRSIDKIANLKEIKTFFLTHFGEVTDLTDHLSDLRNALRKYSQFFQPYHLKGMTAEETLPDFRNFVNNFLITQGMDPEDAVAYEDANPSDMSATGLMRYWKKRDELNTGMTAGK